MQQMYACPNCNSPVTYGDKFCGACGSYLNWPAQQQMPPPGGYQQPPGYQYQQQPPPPGWGQPPPAWGPQPPGWGPYQSQQQQNIYGYGPGAPKKKGSSSGSALLIGLVIIMMLAGAFGVLTGGTFNLSDLKIMSSSSSPSGSTPPPTGSSSDNTTTPAAPEKVQVSAQGLIEAYTADPAAAETAYKGKICEINGTLATYGITEPYYVLLTITGSPDDPGVKCMFDVSHLLEIQKLEPKQNVTIEGKVGDYNVDVTVNDCKFVK